MIETETIKVPEAAKLAGCSPTNVNHWIKQGKFKANVEWAGFRKFYVIEKSSFLNFIEKRKKELGKT